MMWSSTFGVWSSQRSKSGHTKPLPRWAGGPWCPPEQHAGQPPPSPLAGRDPQEGKEVVGPCQRPAAWGANTPPHVRDTRLPVCGIRGQPRVSYLLDVTTCEGQRVDSKCSHHRMEESYQLIFKFKFVTKEITSHRKMSLKCNKYIF